MTYILLLILLALAVILLLAARQPDSFSITRAGSLPAAPEAVTALLQDFHQWQNFSPWEALDPNLSRSFSGADQGTGAAYAWVGNKKVGRGNMLITSTTPGQSVAIDLNFEAPMKANNKCLFTLRPEGSGSHLTWTMSGKNSFTGKIFALIFNIDKMVGKDFEKGINNLRDYFAKSA
jgi:hypothetical protein